MTFPRAVTDTKSVVINPVVLEQFLEGTCKRLPVIHLPAHPPLPSLHLCRLLSSSRGLPAAAAAPVGTTHGAGLRRGTNTLEEEEEEVKD